ncbi:hypothetical protein [Gloeobacter violaceus]|uniref:Gll0272 protein n=1 Tax=Gloeobacter violaceus (strain ATCC 29082 / PCC 7421) TaxID=251221 RepID=Q7NNY6_GLOVI|nr:hypothetical protein [Gloeobacter violaceus]BAC88213.1 gll0272 [Gloeobacter violaceus PCC 7421]
MVNNICAFVALIALQGYGRELPLTLRKVLSKFDPRIGSFDIERESTKEKFSIFVSNLLRLTKQKSFFGCQTTTEIEDAAIDWIEKPLPSASVRDSAYEDRQKSMSGRNDIADR